MLLCKSCIGSVTPHWLNRLQQWRPEICDAQVCVTENMANSQLSYNLDPARSVHSGILLARAPQHQQQVLLAFYEPTQAFREASRGTGLTYQ